MFHSTLKEMMTSSTKQKDLNKYLSQKVIALCDCGKGQEIKGHGSIRVVTETEGFCNFCRHAVIFKRINGDWSPDDGMPTYKKRVKKDKDKHDFEKELG